MNEELIDKYLNQSLNSEEEQEFLGLLKDEEFGRFLVKYCVEVNGYHSTAAKMLEDDLEKNKSEWVDLDKQRSGRWSLVAVIAAAALLAVSVILFIPVNESSLVSANSLSIERNGEKVLSTSFVKGDIISSNEEQLVFDDGSEINLSGSITIGEIDQGKTIFLNEGGAEFSIAKQKQGQTFKIISGETEVEVVGTSFAVKRSGNETRVTVSSGAVKFTNKSKSILLHKGDKAVDVNGKMRAELSGMEHTKGAAANDPSLIFSMNFDGADPLAKEGLSGKAVLRKGQFSDGMLEGSKALQNGLIEIVGSEEDNFRIPMTINAWVKVNKSTFYGPIITKGDSTWRMQLSEEGETYHGGYGLTVRGEFFNGVNKIKTGMWQMITLVYSDKLAVMYVDGKFEQKKETELMHLNSSSPIQIGGNFEMPERYFDGLIDEVSIYNRALSEEEIQLLYRRMIK